MKYTTLGKTGIEVSELTIGAWQLGGPLMFDGQPDGHPDPGKESVIRMIQELGDLGINAIDTAEQYSAGESERRVGEAIAGNRDKWVISTKFGYRVGPNNTRIDDSTPPTILPSLEGSLKRLNTDYIDVYLYHCMPEVDDLDAGREILEKAKADGKIRSYGISTADLSIVEAMVQRDMLDVLQFPTNLLEDRPDLRALAFENGIGTQIRGIMAQGRLSGKYFKSTPDWRSDDNRAQWFNGSDFTKYAILQNAVPEGYTMAQLAIRWILDQPAYHTICMGAKNIEDYRTAIAALDLPALTPETLEALNSFADQLR